MSDPQTLAREISDYIDAAEARLAKGEMVDLTGLDGSVEALCDCVKDMSLEDARTHGATLDALYEKLDAFATMMQETRTKIEAEIGKVNTQRKAARAYRKEPK